jgi:hypothetical protein
LARGIEFGQVPKIEPVILSALELLKSEKTDNEYLSLVKEGLVLWDEMKRESF